MRVQDHIGLISWSLLDKGLYILYGFILIVIMNRTDLPEFGLYSLLIGLHTWIFTISDSFALQSLIQFGMNENNRGKVNLIAFITHIVLTLGVSLIIFLLRFPLVDLFNEPRIADIASFLPLLSIAFIPRTYCQKIIYRIQNMFFLFLSNLLFFGVITIFVLVGINNGGRLTFANLSYYYLFGSIASSIMALILTYKHISFSHRGEIGWRKIYEFSWKMTVINLLHSLPKNIDIFIIKIFFTLEVVGLYSAAKNLFRVFEETINALNGLLYPASVRNLEKKNFDSLHDMLSKSVSFIMFGFIILTLIFYTRLGTWVIEFLLPNKYMYSLQYFRILLIASPFMSFIAFYTLLTADNKLSKVLFGVSISNLFFLGLLIVTGLCNYVTILPLGLVVYYLCLGLIGLYYGQKIYNFRNKSILRAFYDTIFFIKNK